jgi:chloramphenicol 3-O-phosphotransferase
VHVVSDEFYYFISNLLLPAYPEARDQNETVVTAVARASAAYAAGGYDVLVDGVFGPWLLPLLAKELQPASMAVDYIVLRATLEDALERVARADRAAPEMDGIVRTMHAQFEDLGPLEGHDVDTHGRTLDEVVGEIARRLPSGDFRLDLSAFM